MNPLDEKICFLFQSFKLKNPFDLFANSYFISMFDENI